MTADSISQPSVLIIDDDAEIRYSLQRVLSARDYAVQTASSGREGIEMARSDPPEVIFLDNRMEGMTGIETLQHLRSASPRTMVILMTAFGTTQTAIEAMKFGAFDYIVKPFNIRKVLDLAGRAVQARRELESASTGYAPLLNSEDYQEGIVGESDAMREVFKRIGQVAASDVTVMITGESGTGKELVARCLWRHSLRQDRPFLAVNCAAIPENLIESELFGHEKGAFTGANVRHSGKFERCDGGTIFLDEIGDMALSTQTKILRAIQEGEIQRVGGSESISVDVRLIAATNRPLEQMVAEKSFREDLYYRLNVMRIALPPLRERAEDVPHLVDFILQRLGKERKSRVRQISRDALAELRCYPWPGNVRELENVIQRCSVIAQGEAILPSDLPSEIRAHARSLDSVSGESVEPSPDDAGPALDLTVAAAVTGLEGSDAGALSLEEAYDLIYRRVRETCDERILQKIEREMIARALNESGGNQVKTASLLGMTRATLRKRIDHYGLKY